MTSSSSERFLLIVSGLLLTSFLAGCTQSSWPPVTQKMSTEAPVLTPEQALDSFYLPPGYEIELVAAEPLVVDPVEIEFDGQGRMWVVEMRSYMPNLEGEGERRPTGTIAVLEDANDDGRMDRRTVFLDSLVLPRSIKVLQDGVLVGAPPNLWWARDTDGDLRADERRAVRTDYGNPRSNPEHNANGLMWGMDNWIHNADHEMGHRLRDGTFAHRRTVDHGQWGISMDDLGRIYLNSNSDPLRIDLLDAHYYARNPNLARARGLYEDLVEDESVWPVRPTPGVNRGYRPGLLRADSTLSRFTAAGSPVVYRGDRLPEELRGDVFVSEPAGNLVRRFEIERTDSGSLRAYNPYEEAEFLASTDERFRPVNFYSGPDGTLYVIDMYRGIIQHRDYVTDYLEGQIRRRGLETPIGLGRIYRVVHESTERGPRPRLRESSSGALVEHLTHPNGWWRDRAQQLLVQRSDSSVVPAVRSLLEETGDERFRLHALWTLEGLSAVDPRDVRTALRDSSPHVRAAGIRVAEPLMAGDPAIRRAVLNRTADSSATVHRQLAASLGTLPPESRTEALTRVLARRGSDPVVVDAAISGLHGREISFLDRLLETSALEEAAGRRAIVRWLTAAALEAEKPGDRKRLIGWIGEEARPAWVRMALMDGLDEHVPTPEEDEEEFQPLELDTRPEGLLTAASSPQTEIRRRAQSLLERLAWQDSARSGSADAAASLTSAERARLERGRAVYKARCAACHGADGTGRIEGAANLSRSNWVDGDPGALTRIVLHGKEGDHLMPPQNTLTDGEIAAVLTYVRRAWDNRGSPVDSALVRKVRNQTEGRTRPWTGSELEMSAD